MSSDSPWLNLDETLVSSFFDTSFFPSRGKFNFTAYWYSTASRSRLPSGHFDDRENIGRGHKATQYEYTLSMRISAVGIQRKGS